MSRRRNALLLLMLLLAAFALRLLQLDAQSIWWDEGISLHLATSALSELLADRLANIHPPLYFVLLKGWLFLTGINPFSARYLSVLSSWLGIALIYAVARRGGGRQAGWAAVLLGAVSAAAVVYAQEVRVYAMLPLIYLGLLGVTRELVRPAARDQRRFGLWAVFAALAWSGLHLHYIAVFALLTAGLWASIVFLRGGRWRDMMTLLVAAGVVGLASLPWFTAVLRNWSAVRGEANAGTFVAEAAPWSFLLGQVWGFHLTGLPNVMGREPLRWLLLATAVLMLGLLLWRLAVRLTRQQTALQAVLWLLPLGSALLVWQVRSFSHPRYVAMFVPGLLLLVAVLGWPLRPGAARRDALAARALGVVLAIAVFLSSMIGLWLYFTDPALAKDDVRGAAQFLQREATAGDLILVPDTDYALQFEYEGPAEVLMPGWDGPGDTWSRLGSVTAGAARVFVLDYPRGTRDWQERLPFALAAAGRQVGETAFDGVVIKEYALEAPVASPALQATSADFGPLRLSGVWAKDGAAAGEPLAVALRWQAVDPAALARTGVALRLLDESGWEVAAADDALLDENGRPPSQWSAGQEVITYHLLELPAAVPPLDYALGVQLYEAGEAALQALELRDGQGAPQGREALAATVTTARGPLADPEEVSRSGSSRELAEGLVLQDARLPAGEIAAGQPLIVELLWGATAVLPDLRPALELRQGERVLAVADDAPVNGRYPTAAWEPGELVAERRALLPPSGASGMAQVVLRLGENVLPLGEVLLTAVAQQFEPPPIQRPVDAQFSDLARLVGYEVAVPAGYASQPLPLTLVWQATADGGATSYTVFVHLVAPDGRIIAQHDGLPAGGSRPTTGWVEGEYIVDAHDLVFRDPDYSGPAQFAVGLYDAQTGVRLPLAGGGESFTLPSGIEILP